VDVDPNHFATADDGAIYPQPWMQLRRVGVARVAAKSGNYGVSGGQNKNDLLQTVQVNWENDSPIPAQVWGRVTRGGSKVTLQATSRGGIVHQHGYATEAGPIKLTDASMLAVGLNIGRGGILQTGTAFGITEVRQPRCTTYLCPDKTGLVTLQPGDTFYSRVDVRFVTSIWEGTDPDGGAAGSESTYSAGELILELFALPLIPAPS